jgi:hypothetical protein
MQSRTGAMRLCRVQSRLSVDERVRGGVDTCSRKNGGW